MEYIFLMIKGKDFAALLHLSCTQWPSKIPDKKHKGPPTLLFCIMQSVQLQFWEISDVSVEHLFV